MFTVRFTEFIILLIKGAWLNRGWTLIKFSPYFFIFHNKTRKKDHRYNFYSHPLYLNFCLLLSSAFLLLLYELSAVLPSSGEFIQKKKEYRKQQKTEIVVKRMRIVLTPTTMA